MIYYFLIKNFLILLFTNLAKGHEKANKGNSVEPFVYRGYTACLARVRESVLCEYKRRCAYERERERERERESSKLFGTAK